MKDIKEEIRSALLNAGAVAVGFAKAGEIDTDARRQYREWIGEGLNGEMEYLNRHLPLREHTDNVLSGANTVISMAFDYTPAVWLPEERPIVAAYAYGEDYHLVIREKLKPVLKEFEKKFGGKWRLCIDSAPVAERYWAVKSGIGKIGLNGNIIVEGVGSMCFLSEILTTIEIEPDKGEVAFCEGCGLCIDACPGKALRGRGVVDAGKCINYLTIEKKGEFTPEETELVREGRGHLYGCDHCLRVCPHNLSAFSVPQNRRSNKPLLFPMLSAIKALSPESLEGLTEPEFKALFRRSPLIYAGYSCLRRSAQTLKPNPG